ncbi:MAG: hypothetical protein ABSG30_05335 [Steroidobacteraceae bacterium]
MPTPADERLLELLEKWLKSLELHVKYAGLDSDSYWKVQPWPEHQRPSRWIIDLAAQKAGALKAQLLERIAKGDTKFADSLELMTFLANLIGSEHIERFIPLAEADKEQELERSPEAQSEAHKKAAAASPTRTVPPARGESTGTTSVTREMPKFAAAKRPAHKPAARGAPDSPTATREMPHLAAAKRRAPAPVGTAHVARTERRASEAAPARTSAKQPARIAPPHGAEAARAQVIADAARLVQWGRKWYELAELIARMADRPPLPEVRRILKDNKTAIEKKAGGG